MDLSYGLIMVIMVWLWLLFITLCSFTTRHFTSLAHQKPLVRGVLRSLMPWHVISLKDHEFLKVVHLSVTYFISLLAAYYIGVGGEWWRWFMLATSLRSRLPIFYIEKVSNISIVILWTDIFFRKIEFYYQWKSGHLHFVKKFLLAVQK